MSDDHKSGESPGLTGHLSNEQQNAYLDDQMSADERFRADEHLARCESCQEALTQFTILTSLLGELPEYATPRSFRLTEQQIAAPATWVDRLSAWLMPAMPAMRTAMLLLVLAFGGVTIGRILQDDENDAAAPNVAMVITESPVPTQSFASTEIVDTQQADTAAPTTSSDRSTVHDAEAAGQSGEGESAADQAPAAVDDGADMSSAAQDDTGGADPDEAMESAPMTAGEESESTVAETIADDSIAMMKAPEEPATPDASPSPVTASPAPIASPQPTPTASTDSTVITAEVFPWRAIQVALVALIGLLAVGLAIGRRGIHARGGTGEGDGTN